MSPWLVVRMTLGTSFPLVAPDCCAGSDRAGADCGCDWCSLSGEESLLKSFLSVFIVIVLRVEELMSMLHDKGSGQAAF